MVQPLVRPSCGSPLAQPHPRHTSALVSEILCTANIISAEGFSRGKSDGSRPAHLSIPEHGRRQSKFPGGPHRCSQRLGAHRRGRRLVHRFPATRGVATPVQTGSCAPSRGRPRGGALVPSCATSARQGRSQQRQMQLCGSGLGPRLRSAGPGQQEAEGEEPRGHELSVSSRRPDAGSAPRRITVRFVPGVCLAL